jgi:hypothetical protein
VAISRLSPPSCDRHNAYRRQNPTASVSYSRGGVVDETEVPPDKKSKLPHRAAFRDFLDVRRALKPLRNKALAWV